MYFEVIFMVIFPYRSRILQYIGQRAHGRIIRSLLLQHAREKEETRHGNRRTGLKLCYYEITIRKNRLV